MSNSIAVTVRARSFVKNILRADNMWLRASWQKYTTKWYIRANDFLAENFDGTNLPCKWYIRANIFCENFLVKFFCENFLETFSN